MATPLINVAAPGVGAVLMSCVIGAAHKGKAKPCQDASLVDARFYKGHPYTLLAVADGHGAARYSRSEIGAHFAVQAASEAAARWIPFATASYEQDATSWVENASSDFGARFARWLHESWKRQVYAHVAAYPLSEHDDGRERAETAYGTTVVIALVFHDHVFLGGIGDSSIHVVQEDVTRTLSVTAFPEHLASEVVGLTTDSLASDHVGSRWQHRAIDLSGVRLLCVATDGFTDSLTDVAHTLLKLTADIGGKGLTWLSAQLPKFLERLTTDGVGDDIAAVLYVKPSSSPAEAPVESGDPSASQSLDEELRPFGGETQPEDSQ
jgi:serine/threonine protein phosphatase PrpC